MKRSLTRRIALAGSLAIAIGCSSDKLIPTDARSATLPSGMAVKVKMTPSIPTDLAPGASLQLSAVATDPYGQPAAALLQWTSSNNAVAFIGPFGLSATGLGVAVITVSVRSNPAISDSIIITVRMPVKTISVGLASASIGSAATTQASATLRDSLGQVLAGRTVTWSSANSTVATVNAASGIVTGVSGGTSTITATSGSVTGSATVTVVAAAPAHPNEAIANLPQVYLNTTMPAAPAAGGTIISVPAGGNFQAALYSAKPGDVIELANGATFSGNFDLPNKNTTSTNWIVIRPANMAGVPAEGSRMTPSLAAAARLPIILSISNQGAFNTSFGAHHYRLVALEVSVPASINNTGLIRLGSSYETSLAQMPHDLVLDRMYIHGTATGENRRCVALNSASSAVIDSYISDCHEHGGDSQAIAGWSGPGPFKIVNNYLEAASENILFGGGDPAIAGLIPSDIEIRHNHFTKQLAWKGQGWQVKNLFELKSVQRILVEGNLFENNWADAQGGSAIALKSVNQSGTCPWCGTQDVTFRLNLIKNTGSGFNLTGYDPQTPPPVPMTRVTIMDNIISGIDVGMFDGDGRGILLNSNPIDLVIAHNTIMDPTNSAITFGGPATEPPVRLIIRDNIIGGGQYGVKGPGMGTATALATFMPTGGFFGNVITATTASEFPAGNFSPATILAVGFVNAAAFDFNLASSSLYRLRATDARDPGANVNAVNAAVAGIIVP
jgi:hypothetical protein